MTHFFTLALGPHPQRELTLMPRLGFTVLGSARHPGAAAAPGAPAWPQALLHWRWGPTASTPTRGCRVGDPGPARTDADASPRIHSPRLGTPPRRGCRA